MSIGSSKSFVNSFQVLICFAPKDLLTFFFFFFLVIRSEEMGPRSPAEWQMAFQRARVMSREDASKNL